MSTAGFYNEIEAYCGARERDEDWAWQDPTSDERNNPIDLEGDVYLSTIWIINLRWLNCWVLLYVFEGNKNKIIN